MIERDIIPRLYLAHRDPSGPQPPREAVDAGIDLADSSEFARIVLTSGSADIMERVQALIDGGISMQRIYLDLLAPVARRLGELWLEDRCTFVDVSIGLSRLQHVLREMGRRNGAGVRRAVAKRRIYLAPVPGEQHTFGLSMVEEFFLDAGWETSADQAAPAAAILQTVSTQRIDIIGLSISGAELLGPTAGLIRRLRAASVNPAVAIMVGGRLLADHPEVASQLDGAMVVADGAMAVEVADTLVASGLESPPERPRITPPEGSSTGL